MTTKNVIHRNTLPVMGPYYFRKARFFAGLFDIPKNPICPIHH